MKKKDLQKAAGISSASITKLGKNEVIRRYYKNLFNIECDISDIWKWCRILTIIKT